MKTRTMNWWKEQKYRYGKWAYLLLGLCLSGLFAEGYAIAEQIVEQGRGGKYGPWPVTATLLSPDGGVGTLPVVGVVVTTSRDGGLPQTVPQVWRIDSTKCLIVAANSASLDAGTLLYADGGVAVSGALYRCINPSASVGDLCYLEGGGVPTSCTAPTAMMRIAPGTSEFTTLTAPVKTTSSSGEAGLACCQVVFP